MDSGVDTEVIFNTGDQDQTPETPETRIPPTPITQCDMDIIIRGWEAKFTKIVECLREVQLTSERASSDMCLVGQEARAQSHEHDRRLAEFLRKFEDIDALRASTTRRYPTFGYQTSPVVREEVSHPPSTLPHFKSARTEDEEEAEEPRNSLPHISSARTGEQISFRDTRIRDSENSRNTLPHISSALTGEHLLFRDTRTRDHDDEIRETRNREQNDVRDTRTLQFRLTTNGIAQRPKTTHRLHARHRARKCRHSMDLTLPNFALG